VARPTATEPVERLRRLGAPRDEGLLTEEEFQAKTAELLREL
jgi:hypothetical protein